MGPFPAHRNEYKVQIDGDETDSSNHPFHMHVNPFQVVGIGYNNASALDINVGEWRPVTTPESIIRFVFVG